MAGKRFLLHVLPKGFQRIRHYGFLANRVRAEAIAGIRSLILEVSNAVSSSACQEQLAAELTEVRVCPECGEGEAVLEIVAEIDPLPTHGTGFSPPSIPP